MKKLMILMIALTGIFILRATICFAVDSNDIITSLDALINSARIHEYPPQIGISHEKLQTTDPCQVLTLLGKHENDPCRIDKERAYRREVYFAKMRPEPWVKQEVVCRLVKAFIDPNSGLKGPTFDWLLTFTDKDFNNEAKQIIREMMSKKRPSQGIIAICGVANIQEELPRLKGLLIDETAYMTDSNQHREWYGTVGWSARLARARMGVKEDIKKCIELVETEKDTHRRVTILLHDIAYIRQPEAIDFLMKYVFSDERLEQVKPTAPGEPVASYVIDILAGCLENFPVKSGGRHYELEEIELCRKWMSEQKEWKIIR